MGALLTLEPSVRVTRGDNLRRVVRAAAALQGLYTDREIAGQLGISHNTLSAWWRRPDAHPSAVLLERVASEMGLPLAYLTAIARGDEYAMPVLRAPVEGQIQPQGEAEERLAELVREAYERGFAAGFRAGRQSARDEV